MFYYRHWGQWLRLIISLGIFWLAGQLISDEIRPLYDDAYILGAWIGAIQVSLLFIGGILIFPLDKTFSFDNFSDMERLYWGLGATGAGIAVTLLP